jgi:hypothetical protein
LLDAWPRFPENILDVRREKGDWLARDDWGMAAWNLKHDAQS